MAASFSDSISTASFSGSELCNESEAVDSAIIANFGWAGWADSASLRVFPLEILECRNDRVED
jgi:hypothetical protein